MAKLLKQHLNGTSLIHADNSFGGPEVGPSISVTSSESIACTTVE